MVDVVTTIGLMSGTSLDGVDAAVIETDGREQVKTGPAVTVAYHLEFRERLRACLGEGKDAALIAEVERELTELHAEVVGRLLAHSGRKAAEIDLIGFHGHTLFHAPERRYTHQIGDGALLAQRTGIPVVNDFRSADVAAGGQGAPLVPLYHRALAARLERPLVVLNLGGVANVTWLGQGEDEVLACDTGPGNALIDDWVWARTVQRYDLDGELAAAGRVDQAALAGLLDHPYFRQPLPKSLDRGAFRIGQVARLGTEDGAATLAAFTAAAVAAVVPLLPQAPLRWLVTGGGRHNPTLMGMLRERLQVKVVPVEAVGWDGDALEAQAFAYLAARSRLGLPLSLPGTTGVPVPLTGGRFHMSSCPK
ncbi:Anhydro-N-acetylmuramic acid kinase [uncultured Gammaproteobacteria bacterium]